MFQKIIKVCIYLIIFLMPIFWLPFSVEAFDFNKVYLLFFLTSIGVLAWLSKMIFKEQKISLRWNSFNFFVLGFLAVMTLSTVFSNDKISSLAGFYGRFWPSLLGILSLGAFYFLVSNNVDIGAEKTDKNDRWNSKAKVSGLLKAFFLSSFIVTLTTYFSLFGIWAGLGKVLGSNFPPIMNLRIFNPVAGSLEALSLFIACICVFLIVLIAFKDKEGLLKSGKNNKAVLEVLSYVLLFVNFCLLLLINFKASWLVMFISLALFLIFSFWKRIFKENVQRLSLSTFLTIFVLVLFFYNPVQSFLPKNALFNNLPVEVLLNQRLSWNLAGQGIKESPVLGVGPASFYYIFSKFKPASFMNTSFWQLRFDRAGSYIAELAATSGILGILSYVLLVGMFLLVSYFFVASFKLKGVIGALANSGKMEKGAQEGAKEEGNGAVVAKALAEKEERKIMIMPFLIVFVAFLAAQFFYYQNAVLAFSFWLVLALGVVSWGRAVKEKVFSFKEFPEVGLVFGIVFWVLLMGTVFVYFNVGKFYLADVYYRDYLVNPEKNLVKLEKAVRLAPSRSTYHIVLAREYLQRFIAEAAKPTPDIQVATGMVALAVEESKKSIEKSPNWAVAYEMAGIVYREIQGTAQGALEWAMKSFESVLKLEPKNPIVLTELGKLRLLTQENEKARELFNKAIVLKQDYIDAQLQIAFLDDREGKAQEAQGRLENLVRLSPFSVEAHFQLGRIYYNAKEYDKAVEQFQTALAIFPNHSNSLYSLGLVYDKKGDKKTAREMFERVLQLNPGNKDVEMKIEQVKSEKAPQIEENPVGENNQDKENNLEENKE